MKISALVWIAGLTLASVGCGAKNKNMPGTRESGQSRLMGQTFAGQNACSPQNHLRPFIIEWDATDMSSFESYAANDVVVVRYEGCTLTVLDECRDDNVRGSKGAYKPPEWTSGSLETIDISNEGELYAKLPLGSATLGGRVNGGEKFHMEYYVAGTRNATRPALYRAEIADNPGCEGATHFVYAYNLGAFALGSAANLDTTVGGSAFGFGAGGSTSHKQSAEKKGGDLAVCRSDSATEVEGCKAPIRLTLREIREGENPDQEAMEAPDTPESLNAAAMVDMKVEMSAEARARLEAAQAKANAGDGKGCLKELDKHDQLDPKHKSTDPKSGFGLMRAQCLMVSGKCDPGKKLARKSFENSNAAQFGPEQIDRTVDAYAGLYCQGKMGDRDAVLAALQKLQQGAFMAHKTVKFCDEHYGTLQRLEGKVKPKNEDDMQIINLESSMSSMVPLCYQRAGDCKKAWKAYQDLYPKQAREGLAKVEDPETRKKIMRSAFESTVRKCKDK